MYQYLQVVFQTLGMRSGQSSHNQGVRLSVKPLSRPWYIFISGESGGTARGILRTPEGRKQRPLGYADVGDDAGNAAVLSHSHVLLSLPQSPTSYSFITRLYRTKVANFRANLAAIEFGITMLHILHHSTITVPS